MDAQLTVSRNSPADGQQRQILVELDGTEIALLNFGQSVTRTVGPGPHVLRVDNTFNRKTQEIELSPGEHARFRTISRPGKLTWFLVATLGTGPMYVSIEREP